MSPERRSNELSNRVSRRGKRFFRLGFSTLRLFCIVAGLFIVFYTAFGPDMPFHDRLGDRESLRREHQVVEDRDSVQHEANQIISKPLLLPPPPPSPIPRTKPPRRTHFPCEIGFEKSVDYFVEPMELVNFTNFSLEYVDREEATGSLEPRFGGHQTLDDREKSFVAQNQTIHCGFVKEPIENPSIGFDLKEKDKAYMKTCKIVVSSCIFGNSDFFRRPAKKLISDYSKKHVCFVMFLDEQTMSKLSSEGSIPDREGKVGLWKIVVVKNLPYNDMRRTGKVPKLLSHRLFPAARYSIWIDSKMRLNTDPMLILEYFLWRTKSEYAISNHYDRHCVWDEVLQNKRLNKYDHKVIDRQFIFYQSDGLTKFDPSRPNNLLPSYVPEGSFIVRAHTPMSNLFSCLWFNEVDRFTSRDQLSFAYTYLKLRRMNPDKPFYLNMFKDCERRSLAKLFQHRVFSPPPKAP